MIHPTAIIDPSATLAEDVSVGPYSVIGAAVEIDSGCEIASHVVIGDSTRMGKNNRIFQFSSVGEVAQDLKYAGEESFLEIGDDNVIREFVTLHRGTAHGGSYTRIGDHNLFMAYAHVAHDCQVAHHTIFSNAASIAGHVKVDDYAILGGFTCVHQFSHIGAHAFSGLGTIINRDVPPFVMVAGNHASAYGINKRGLKRRGFSDELIQALHQTFKLLVKNRGARDEALLKVKLLAEEHRQVKHLLEFIEGSERGIVR
ncbi:MAG: acyl-ACP--UDP-N-acetylglucosamine O-acyltransferase [Gammaproteobacteria bacterium]|nr:acyl-ACP--UDP-N-acetylglucosamine O-acyltransferase [Gammaproteobacteria bacterium]